MIRRIASVGSVYALSVGLLFFAETLLIKESSASDYGEFRLALNAAPLLALVAMFGNESATARLVAERGLPMRWGPMQSRRMALGLVLGTCFGIYGWKMLDADLFWALGTGVLTSALVGTNFYSAVQRSVGSSALAAWSQQGYRLLGGGALVVVIALGFSLYQPLVFIAAAAVLLAFSGFTWNALQKGAWSPDDRQVVWMSRVGPGFVLSGLTLAGLDLVDQLLIALIAGVAESGLYAAAKLYIVFPILSISSVLAFVALPMAVKFVKTAKWQDVRRALWGGLVLSVIAGMLLGGLGYVALRFVSPGAAVLPVVVPLAVAGTLRLFYAVPISLLSATTGASEIRLLGLVGLAGLCIVVCGGFFYRAVPGWDISAAVATSVAVAVTVRVGAATWLCARSFLRFHHTTLH